MDIAEIQNLIDKARFEKAITRVDELIPKLIEGKLYQSIAYTFLGDLQRAENLAKEVLHASNKNNDLSLEFKSRTAITHLRIYRGDPNIQDDLDKTFSVLEQLEMGTDHKTTFWIRFLFFIEGIHGFIFSSAKSVKFQKYISRLQIIARELDSKFLNYFLELTQVSSMDLSSKFDQGIKQFEVLVHKISTHEYKLLEGYAYGNLAGIYLIKGDFKKFQQYSLELGKVFREIKFIQGEIYYQGGLGILHLNQANLDKALFHYQKALKISNQLKTQLLLGSIYRFIGEINYRKGELKVALVNYQLALKVHQERQNIHGMGETYSHIGKLYQEFGDLEFAHENYQMGLEKRISVDFISGIAASYDLIGNLYLEQNKFETANKYYIKSLEIKNRLGNEFSVASTLFNQIQVYLEIEPEVVPSIFDELQRINQKLNNKQVKLQTLLAKALILKNSTRGLKKSQAQLILQDISQKETIDYRLSVLAILNLTEILLWELKSSSSKEILNDLDKTITTLMVIAKTQNIPSLLIRTHLFQSKLDVLHLNFEGAKKHLNKAEEIAIEKGLRYLAILISNELDSLLKQVDKWGELIEKNLPLDQVIEITQFEQILKRVYPNETHHLSNEEPVLLLIIGQEKIIYSHNFSEFEINENLFNSFLKTIHAYGNNTRSYEESIERIIYQNYTLIIEKIGDLLFCFIINGNSYSAIQKFDTFIESIQASIIWNELVESSGRLENEMFDNLDKICKNLFIYDKVASDQNSGFKKINQVKDDNLEYLEVPKELLSFKFLLNPIRLSIIKILDAYFRYPSAELRKLIGIPWGTFNDHLQALSKKGYIESQKEFIEENARNILYLTSNGASEYSKLKSILREVIVS